MSSKKASMIQELLEQPAQAPSQAADIATAVVMTLKQMGVFPEPKPEEAPPFTPPDVVATPEEKPTWLTQHQPSACRCDECVPRYHVNLTKGRLTGKGLHWRCAGCGAMIGMKTRPTMLSILASRDAKDPIGLQFCSAACGAGAVKGPMVETLVFDQAGRPEAVS